MKSTHKALAVAAALALLVWLMRYEPISGGAPAAVLDRWTGDIHIVTAAGQRLVFPPSTASKR